MDMPSPAPDPNAPDPGAPDPELEPLLGFAPVRRRIRRSDGWPPERQRDFVAALARLGNVARAAHTVGRTSSGAYKVRESANAEGFRDAWDGALAIFHRRNPRERRVGRPSRGELLAEARAAPPAAPPPDPEQEEREAMDELSEILLRYERKLASERTARLAGRIAEADFYVRQLTFIELVMDIGGRTRDVIEALARPGTSIVDMVATPGSVLLDGIRRRYWAEGGEPERPPLGDLGERDDEVATGPARHFRGGRGEDYSSWRRRREDEAALAAEAQAAWEKKARADAKRWRKRVAASPDGAGGKPPPAIRSL